MLRTIYILQLVPLGFRKDHEIVAGLAIRLTSSSIAIASPVFPGAACKNSMRRIMLVIEACCIRHSRTASAFLSTSTHYLAFYAFCTAEI